MDGAVLPWESTGLHVEEVSSSKTAGGAGEGTRDRLAVLVVENGVEDGGGRGRIPAREEEESKDKGKSGGREGEEGMMFCRSCSRSCSSIDGSDSPDGTVATRGYHCETSDAITGSVTCPLCGDKGSSFSFFFSSLSFGTSSFSSTWVCADPSLRGVRSTSSFSTWRCGRLLFASLSSFLPIRAVGETPRVGLSSRRGSPLASEGVCSAWRCGEENKGGEYRFSCMAMDRVGE